VHVEVRHALTHPVVDGDEGALRSELFHRSLQELHVVEDQPDLIGGHIGERLVMISGHEQRVTGEQRPNIEESHTAFGLENDLSGRLAGNDVAESAGHRPSLSVRLRTMPAMPPTPSNPRPLYGLDIETDTSTDGLDPGCSAVVAVALATTDDAVVFDGDEADLLSRLDEALAGLPPGLIVTWNGSAFDLPFLARRAEVADVSLGLRLRLDDSIAMRTEPLPGCDGAYRAEWHGHRHLDGYRLYRADVGRTMGLSCALKAMARLVGIDAVEVDTANLHELSDDEVRTYVASDASVARQLVERRMPYALGFADTI
jgi:hypothetical protein